MIETENLPFVGSKIIIDSGKDHQKEFKQLGKMYGE